MKTDPRDPSTHPTMKWAVTDLILSEQLPTSELNWVYDQQARTSIKGEDQLWHKLLTNTCSTIENRGYSHGRERTAIMTIINLIPDLKGLLSQKFIDRLSYLFDVCIPYVNETNEQFFISHSRKYHLREIIKGNLFRALLDDALNNVLSLNQWQKKAQLFMELAGPDDWKNRQCWNEGLHTSIDWPDLIADKRYTDLLSSPISPDLITCLCLLEKFDYADCLIDMGYDLSHFLLFNFQAVFWRRGRDKPSTLAYVLPFCFRAVKWIEDRQKDPEPSTKASEWDKSVWHRINKNHNNPRDNQLDKNEYQAVLVLKVLSNELKLSECTQDAVDGANAYLNAFKGLSLPNYSPGFLD